MIAAVTAYNATLGQVIGRELGNVDGPTTVDVSVLEAAMCLTDVAGVAGFGDVPARPRLGINRYPPTYPLGVYPCRDGWLGVTALTPDQWHAFCALIGLDELADVPEYQTAMGRLEDAAALEVVICEALAGRSADVMFHEGQRRRIPLAPVPTMAELLTTDQYLTRSAFAPVRHALYEAFPAPVPPFRLYRTPATVDGAPPRLGEHTRAELTRAGYDRAAIVRLLEQRVVAEP
jgi:crotonobetainyl-CoA:carnitine CoA-transferase CaiB-like acyl-CoA transferase